LRCELDEAAGAVETALGYGSGSDADCEGVGGVGACAVLVVPRVASGSGVVVDDEVVVVERGGDTQIGASISCIWYAGGVEGGWRGGAPPFSVSPCTSVPFWYRARTMEGIAGKLTAAGRCGEAGASRDAASDSRS